MPCLNLGLPSLQMPMYSLHWFPSSPWCILSPPFLCSHRHTLSCGVSLLPRPLCLTVLPLVPLACIVAVPILPVFQIAWCQMDCLKSPIHPCNSFFFKNICWLPRDSAWCGTIRVPGPYPFQAFHCIPPLDSSCRLVPARSCIPESYCMSLAFIQPASWLPIQAVSSWGLSLRQWGGPLHETGRHQGFFASCEYKAVGGSSGNLGAAGRPPLADTFPLQVLEFLPLGPLIFPVINSY